MMGLCNILAMKLAFREEMTLCYKIRHSDDLFSGLLKSSNKEYSSIWSRIVEFKERGHAEAGQL